ncbi:MAG: MBL fold metallo-hydrolase [Candidatus Pacebacteria bacterium]|nr:MBL fold metallo-hydrolase [Candidatus Paceibacterota bacterium]
MRSLTDTAGIRLTVLVEDTLGDTPGVQAEHGLAILVEADGRKGLFDTGQTGIALTNAAALGICVEELEWIALSHGHYDHTGGLAKVVERAPHARIFAHPETFRPKYVRESNGTLRPAGCPVSEERLRKLGASLEFHTNPVQLSESVCTTGMVPRQTPYEKPASRFVIRTGDRYTIDTFPDDLSLIVSTGQGPVLVCGCAHAGIVNIISHVQTLTGTQHIHGIFGGLHLGSASASRIARTTHVIRDAEVTIVGANHCTGTAAISAFREAFNDRLLPCPTGTVVSL